MARKKGSKNIHKTKSTKEQFETLDLARKQIVYNYWNFLDSDSQEGWDINKAGFKDHWEISDYIRQQIPEKSFYWLGKVSDQRTLPLKTYSQPLINSLLARPANG